MTDRVWQELRARGQSIEWLADHAGIPRAELSAKLRAEEDLTVVDLASIASALDLPVSTLTPSAPSGDA